VEALKAFLQATKYSLRNQPGTEEHLRRAIDLDPNFTSPRIWLISRLGNTGRTREAEEHLRFLHGLEARASPFDQAMIGWAAAHIAGDAGGQVRNLETALQYTPDNNILLVTLGVARMLLEDFKGALDAFATPLRLRWQYPPLYAMRGECLLELGRLAEARKALLASLDVIPVDSNVYAMLAALALSDRQPEEAARYRELYASRAAERGTDVPTQRADLGRNFVLVGATAEGLALLKEAVAARPREPLFHYWLADALLRRGDTAGAAAAGQRALDIDPGWPRAHLMLGRIDESSGRKAEALRHYQAFLTAAPAHAARNDVLRRVEALRGSGGA
jgi:tetratricopeptide (TPR) repeat protein